MIRIDKDDYEVEGDAADIIDEASLMIVLVYEKFLSREEYAEADVFQRVIEGGILEYWKERRGEVGEEAIDSLKHETKRETTKGAAE